MNTDTAITPEKQAHPDDKHRWLFLKGVLLEALIQGYSIEDRGRLFVVALRAWEGR